MTISNEAVEAAAATWWDLNTGEVEPFEALREEEKRNVAENANIRELLEAAAPFIRAVAGAKALEELVTNSPRLPSAVRNVVFEAVFDVVDKFNFPCQNMGPHADLVEIGDVCGEVERRIVAIIRAATIRTTDAHD